MEFARLTGQGLEPVRPRSAEKNRETGKNATNRSGELAWFGRWIAYPDGVIDTAAIKARFEALGASSGRERAAGCSRPVRRVRPDMAGSLRCRGRRGLRAARLIAAWQTSAVIFSPRVLPTGGGGKPADRDTAWAFGSVK